MRLVLLVFAASATMHARPLRAQTALWDRCMLGIGYGAPFKLAVGYAGGRVVESQDGGSDQCHFAATKLGIGGVRFSLGSMRTINALGGAAGLSVGALRTFGSPLHAQPWRNYAGASLHILPALAFGGEIGYYVRLGNDVNGAPARRQITWSVGFGF